MASDEVKSAIGEAEQKPLTRDEEMAQIAADIGERRAKRARYSQLAAERNTEIAAQQRAALETEAKQERDALVRALGSLIDQSEKDDARFVKTAREYAGAAKTLNDRFDEIIARRHQLQTLCEAFGWPAPELAQLIVPAARPGVADAFAITYQVGVRDNGYVRSFTGNDARRTYEEPELANSKTRELVKRKHGRA